MLLDFDPEVVGYSSQPFWLRWHDGRRRRRHAPDFLVRLIDGRGVVAAQPPPRKPHPPRPRTLADGTRDFVDAIIGQDLQVPSRRRHSVQRIWERLIDEHDVTVSYSTVRDYVIRRRTELAPRNCVRIRLGRGHSALCHSAPLE
jgi:hypothetical protein